MLEGACRCHHRWFLGTSYSLTPRSNLMMTAEIKKKNKTAAEVTAGKVTTRVLLYHVCILHARRSDRAELDSDDAGVERSREASVSGVSTHLDLSFHSVSTGSLTPEPSYLQLCDFEFDL